MTAPDEQTALDSEGTADIRRALIVGGILALLPLVFLGFVIAVFIAPHAKDPHAPLLFGGFILLAMLMFGGFGFAMALFMLKTVRRMARSSIKDVFGPFAEHVSGRVETPSPGLFGLQWKAPTVWFEHRGMPAVLRIETEGSGEESVAYTVLELTLAEASPVELHLFPQGLLTKLARWLGMQDIEVGDAAFDDQFVVQASRESAAATFLNATVRQALLDFMAWRKQLSLHRVTSSSHIELQLRGSSLKLRTLGTLSTPEQLIEFYQHVGRVVDGIFA